MSTSTADEQPDIADLQARIDDLESQLEDVQQDQDQQTKMSIVAINGTLDMAYPTLILSSMAAAFDWDVTVFASFWALDLLHEEKSKNLKVSSLGNPQMPMPNILGVLPGGDRLATKMMRRQIDDINTDTVGELIERAIEHDVTFQACGMAQELMGYEEDDFFDEVEVGVGAGSALLEMADADVQLVI